MKKNVFKLTLSICLLANIVLLNSCASKPAENKVELYEPIVIEGIETVSETGNVVFTNLPQFELMCLVCRLAGLQGFQGYYNGDNAYLAQMATLLEKYKDYSVVKMVQDFSRRGVTDDAFINLAYFIRPDFSGTTVPLNPKPDTLNAHWKDIPSVEINKFVKEMHDFAVTSNFARIYLLNRGTFMSDCLYMQESVKKYKFEEWMGKFFASDESQKIYMNVSRANVAMNGWDFSINVNNEKEYHLSTYPGTDYSSLSMSYLYLMNQSYVDENWDVVKEPFNNWLRKVLIRLAGEDKESLKKAEELELTDWYLNGFIAEIINCNYLDEVLAETEEIYGIKDEGMSMGSKVYGEEVTKELFALIENYMNSRETYPDFKSYYPKINEFVLSLPQD